MTDVNVNSITATWTDPVGTVWPLTDTSPDSGWFTPFGPAGWHATDYEVVSDPLPRGGEQVRFLRSKAGTITWPIYVWGDNHLQYVQRHRQIRRAFAMTMHRGAPGLLTVTRPDGTARSIEAYYSGGLEGEAGQGWMWSQDAVSLWCPDGYWTDLTPVTETRSYVPGVDFLSPFPSVSTGLTLGTTQVTNPGDVQAWPTWTVTGPLTSLTASNITTNYEFSVNYALNAGEQLTIVTDRPQVRGPAGQNLVGAVSWPSAYLWSLDPGDNTLVLNVSNAAVGTAITMSFYPRYEGA